MERALSALARKFREVKFIKIRGSDAIRNYPDNLCPTLVSHHSIVSTYLLISLQLVYKGGKVQQQYVGLTPFAGLYTDSDGISCAR